MQVCSQNIHIYTDMIRIYNNLFYFFTLYIAIGDIYQFYMMNCERTNR